MSITSDLRDGSGESNARLVCAGYRMTGRLADAQDVVARARAGWARTSPADHAGVADPDRWFAAAVGRASLQRLHAAAARRESYIGPWLPEPLVSGEVPSGAGQAPTGAAAAPLADLLGDESIRMAAMVALDRLDPRQRVAFVLRDGLDRPVADIARVLGCPPAQARESLREGTRAMLDAQPPPRAPHHEQTRLIEALAKGVHASDPAAVRRLLHPEAALVSDSGGLMPAARRVVRGADKVARMLVGSTLRYGVDQVLAWAPVLVNGELGWRSGGIGGEPESVSVLSVRDGHISAVYSVVNPAKLATALARTGRPAV